MWQNSVYGEMWDSGTDWQGVIQRDLMLSKYNPANYGSVSPYFPGPDGALNWLYYTNLKLRSWGFNSNDIYGYLNGLNPWNTRSPGFSPDENGYRSNPAKMAGVYGGKVTYYATFDSTIAQHPLKDMLWGAKSQVYAGWRGSMAGDYFDNQWPVFLQGQYVNIPAIYWDWMIGVVVDDNDQMRWLAGSNDFPTVPPTGAHHTVHAGWLALVTSPIQTASFLPPTGKNVVYATPDAQMVYTKQVGLVNFLKGRYPTIAALNSAWGATYTTWSSTGTQATDAIGTGDGTTTTFSGKLSNSQIAPFSVAVTVNGTVVAGDDGNTGTLHLAGTGSGKVTYSTQSITVTLPTAPPAGATVAVTYMQCGFGCGTGLLDEDGTHAWVPKYNSDGFVTTAGNAAITKDLDDFYVAYAQEYFSTTRAVVKKVFPGRLYLGTTNSGGFDSPPAWQALKGMSPYVDVIRLAQILPSDVPGDYLARLNYISTWGGDRPWTMWIAPTARHDWYFDTKPCNSGNASDQPSRSLLYANLMGTLSMATSDGVVHFAGANYWEVADSRPECTNFGLITLRDNAYDGVEATSRAGTDRYGLPTGCIPDQIYNALTSKPPSHCELGNYGNVIDSIREANLLWIPGLRVADGAGSQH